MLAQRDYGITISIYSGNLEISSIALLAFCAHAVTCLAVWASNLRLLGSGTLSLQTQQKVCHLSVWHEPDYLFIGRFGYIAMYIAIGKGRVSMKSKCKLFYLYLTLSTWS